MKNSVIASIVVIASLLLVAPAYATVVTIGTGLYWDDVNQFLGIGVPVPTQRLDIAGVVKATSLVASSTPATSTVAAIVAPCFSTDGINCLSAGAGASLSAANTWTQKQTFTLGFLSQASSTVAGQFTAINSSTTNETVGSFFAFPTATTCPGFAIASLCWDTTENQLQVGTSTTGFPAVISTHEYIPFTSFSGTGFVGTTTQMVYQVIPSAGMTFVGFRCKTNTGTFNAQFGTLSASTTMFSASTTNNYNLVTVNNAAKNLTVGTTLWLTHGTIGGSPLNINCVLDMTVNPS